MSSVRSIERARDKKAAQGATIRATLEELLIGQPALRMLTTRPLPARDAFKLSKIAKAVERELKSCDETRLKLCQQYGELNKETNKYEFPDNSQREALDKEYSELIQTEVEIPGERLKVGIIPEPISAGDLMPLHWLIED